MYDPKVLQGMNQTVLNGKGKSKKASGTIKAQGSTRGTKRRVRRGR